MKKVIFVIAIAASIIACTKEGIVDNAKSQTSQTNNEPDTVRAVGSNNNNTASRELTFGKMLAYSVNSEGVKFWFCESVATMCYVVGRSVGGGPLTQAQSDALDDLNYQCDNGTPSNFFSTGNHSVLFPSLSTENLNTLTSSNNMIVRSYDSSLDNYVYMVMSNTEDPDNFNINDVIFALEVTI